MRDGAKRIAASPPIFAIGPGRTGIFGENAPLAISAAEIRPNDEEEIAPGGVLALSSAPFYVLADLVLQIP
jgi:hypothetical protein